MIDHLELLEEMYSDIYLKSLNTKDNILIEYLNKELNKPIITFNQEEEFEPKKKISVFKFIKDSRRAWQLYERVLAAAQLS